MSSGTKARGETRSELEALRARVAQLERERNMRIQAEDALRESEQKLRLLAENIQDVFWMSTPGIREMIYVSPAYEKIWRRTCASLYASPQSFMDAIHPDDRERVSAGVEKHARGSWDYEYRIVQPDGRIRWIQDRGFPIRDEEGKLLRMCGVASDITERKKWEEDLREQRDLLDSIIEGTDDLVFAKDLDGRYVLMNSADAGGFGKSVAEVVGLTDLDLFPPDQAERVMETDRQIIASGKSTVYEQNFGGPAHDTRTYLVYKYPRFDQDGKVIGVLGIARDITDRKRAEEALRKSESEKSLILNAASELIIYQDTQHTIVWTNQAAATSVGQRYRNLTGRKCYEVWHNRKTPCEDCPVSRALETGKSAQGEVVTPDGRVWLIRGTPIHDESGAIVSAIEVTLEITDRKQTLEALRKSEARFRGILDNTAHGIALVDTTGHIVHVNAKWAEMLGYTPEELRQKSVSEITHPDDLEDNRKKNQALFDGQIDFFRIEKRYIRKDGSTFWADLSVRPLRDTTGLITGAVGIIVDITERKHAEEALERSERDYRGLFENAHDAIMIFRPEGEVVLEVNARACAMYRFSRSEFLGMSLETISRNVAHGKAHIHKLLEKGVMHGIETVQYRKDGTEMHLEINAAVIEYQGQQAILTVNRDVTERRRIEEELARYRDRLEELVEQRTRELDASREQLRRAERVASIGTLAAGIAHEINNPVGMILLAAENAKTCQGQPNTQSRLDKCLDNIVASAERCGHITEGVLRFAKPQTTKKAPADLNAIMEHAVLLTRKYVKERGGTIELQPAPDLPQVLVNTVEMEQAFINLIRNAVEAAIGKVRIAIRTLAGSQGVRVVVQDDGPGVAEDDLEHLFDPFFTTRREKGGTGLGLSIVHGIITGHGGSVGAESCPGKGSTFTIELPAISPCEAEAENAEGADC